MSEVRDLNGKNGFIVSKVSLRLYFALLYQVFRIFIMIVFIFMYLGAVSVDFL